jgi:hypothetical protein
MTRTVPWAKRSAPTKGHDRLVRRTSRVVELTDEGWELSERLVQHLVGIGEAAAETSKSRKRLKPKATAVAISANSFRPYRRRWLRPQVSVYDGVSAILLSAAERLAR